MAEEIKACHVNSVTDQLLIQIRDEMRDMQKQDARIAELEVSSTRMVSAVENVNKTIEDFVNAIKKMEDKTINIYVENQSIMKDIKAILENQSKNDARFSSIEKAQRDGCPSSLGARERIALELKHIEKEIKILATASGKNREEINALQHETGVQKEQISVSNNRLKDLESFQTRTTWAILGGGATMILSLIGTVFNFLKH